MTGADHNGPGPEAGLDGGAPSPDETVNDAVTSGQAPVDGGDTGGARVLEDSPPEETSPPGEQALPDGAPPSGELVGPAAAQTKRPPSRQAVSRSNTRKAPTPSTKRGASIVRTLEPPVRPTTLAIDIGGTGLKASVLDGAGKLVADRVRIPTPYPCTTKAMISALTGLVAPLPAFDRVAVGFPGVVRKGLVLTAPHFVRKTGAPGEPVVGKLLASWTGFDIGSALADRLGHPVRVANDADLQGLDVVSGSGLEFVITLGTGVGTALFYDGKLTPHLELAQHPFRQGQTYDEQLGDAPMRRIGAKKWRKRLEEAIKNFEVLLNYDRLYIGGGNARFVVGYIDPSVTIVDNVAGILGGIRLWDEP
jgi:polyphosphate glucokinase